MTSSTVLDRVTLVNLKVRRSNPYLKPSEGKAANRKFFHPSTDACQIHIEGILIGQSWRYPRLYSQSSSLTVLTGTTYPDSTPDSTIQYVSNIQSTYRSISKGPDGLEREKEDEMTKRQS